MQRTIATAVLVLLAGCAGAPAAPQDFPRDGPEDAPAVPQDPAGVPKWETGRWWQVRLRASFGGFEDMRGRIVVAGHGGATPLVGTDALNISLFDRYFDHVYVGPVGADLNPVVLGKRVQLFEWPLVPNRTWKTPFPTANLEEGRTGLTNATLRSSLVDGYSGSDRIRVLGTSDRNEAIDYDVDAKSGWLTYLRVTNATTGKVLLALDVEDAGVGHKGEVHRLLLTTLKERFAILPPCDERARCYPEALALPPIEPVTVPGGFTWVDEIAFLFTFPIIVGGGAASFQFVRPDGKVDQDTHKGAGDRFEFTLRRYEARGSTAGTWGVGLEVAGTAGAFVGLYGVKDEVTQL